LDEVIIAVPSADGDLVRRVIMESMGSRVPIRIVPRRDIVLKNDFVMYRDVKVIEPDDFLGRKSLKRNISKLSRYYGDKVVMVTGGAGSIGSEIVRQLIDVGAKRVVIFDRSENLCFELIQGLSEMGGGKRRYEVVVGDILNKKKLGQVMDRFGPDIVVHAAAYKHVSMMENNPDEAIRVNVLGTKNVVDAASGHKVKRFVHISTDKVVDPVSIMGATKKLAECYVRFSRGQGVDFSIVRFGNVVNSQGSVLPLFARQIRDHGYVTVTDKRMKRFFMSIREAAQLVLMSATQKGGGSVYVLNMGDLIGVYDVARCLIRSNNLLPDVDVQIKFIGKRKGEKMVEQLFTETEKKVIEETGLDNIWRISDCEQCPDETDDKIGEIDRLLASSQAKMKVTKFLKGLYPSLKND
jgi:FlaA1/EpsC-like NDP-sugar epimerase